MRQFILSAFVAALVGCGNAANRERMNDPGPPADTGNGKGLPAMKPPGEGGKAFSTPPKVGSKQR